MENKEIVWYNATSKALKELGINDKKLKYIVRCTIAESRAFWCTQGPQSACAVFKANGTKYVKSKDFPIIGFSSNARRVNFNVIRDYGHWLEDRPGRRILDFIQKPLNNPTRYYKECVSFAPGGMFYHEPYIAVTRYKMYMVCVQAMIESKFQRRSSACRALIVHPKFELVKSILALTNSANNSKAMLYKVPKIIDNIVRCDETQVMDDIILPIMSKYIKVSFKLLVKLSQEVNDLPPVAKITILSFYIYLKRERILNRIQECKKMFDQKGPDVK
jgi:hypothetical protein